MTNDTAIVAGYLSAKERLLARGYGSAIDWQHSVKLDAMTESDFLRESAWVVLSAGMSAKVVSTIFPAFSTAFFHWSRAEQIVQNDIRCRRAALEVFSHAGKVDAVLEISRHVDQVSFSHVKHDVAAEGVTYLRSLPYIGPITAFHLAKNLGLDVAKPDRHLVRLASHLGFSDAAALCAVIAASVGDRIAVVDLVLWQHTALYGIQPGPWS